MAGDSRILFPAERTAEELRKFRASTPETAVLTVFKNFKSGIENQIPKFDSDETLELVLRFPGLPDAIAGEIRGMRSYHYWLYYRLKDDGAKQGYHYLQSPKFVADYRELLEQTLGREVVVEYSDAELSEIDRRDVTFGTDDINIQREHYLYGNVHEGVRAIIFDLDNTLAPTDSLAQYRTTGNRQGLVNAVRLKRPEVHQEFQHVLAEVSQVLPIAIVTVAPRWYAEYLLTTLFPNFNWATIVTYEDVVRHKPFPDAFQLAAEWLRVDKKDILVVGDSRDDVEAAYHAGMQVALATWHHKDQEGLRFFPDAVFESPMDLLYYLTSPTFHLPFLEAWLMDTDWEHLDYLAPLTATTNVSGQPNLPVSILGRYFPRYDQTLARHEEHLLSRQIITKERPEPFKVPDSWIHPLSLIINQREVDIVTVIPAKPGKDQRLERILSLLEVDNRIERLPELLRFLPGMRDVRRLPAAEKYAEVLNHLVVNGNCAGKRVLVLDDVLTQGGTMQAATEKLLEGGATEVERMVIAKTISPTLFRVRAEVRYCKKCGAIMAHRTRRDGQGTFWSCSKYFEEGCVYIEND